MAPFCKKWKTEKEKNDDSQQSSSRSIVEEEIYVKEGTIVKEQCNDRQILMNRTCYDYNDMGPLFCLLPMEMLWMILSYLDAPSLACFGGTCKVLYHYCDQMWKPLCADVVDFNPTVLCVPEPVSSDSIYSYDNAVELCKRKKYKMWAIRTWLVSRQQCVACYNLGGIHHVVAHVDVTLCKTCYSLFYRRKGRAKEEFSLTDKDLRMIANQRHKFLVSDLITFAREKYGGKKGLRTKMEHGKRQKKKRVADKECALVSRECEVVAALYNLGSSYHDVSAVEPGCMPYVSSRPDQSRILKESAEDAANWLISCKNRQETRRKAMADEIRIRCGRCEQCQAGVDSHLTPQDCKCPYITAPMAESKMCSVYENCGEDIQHYIREGSLPFKPWQCDMVQTSAAELMTRHDRICDLKKELEFRKDSWLDVFQGGKIKDPMLTCFAQDFINNGEVNLENKANAMTFCLEDGERVASVIIAFANNWDSRKKEITEALLEKGVSAEALIEPRSQTLVDEFVDNVVEEGDGRIITNALSASEVAEKVFHIENLMRKGKLSSDVAQRHTRILAECNPDFKELQLERKRDLLGCLMIASFEELGSSADSCQRPMVEFVTSGKTESLFGHEITTANSVAELIRLKQRVSLSEGMCIPGNQAYPK